MHMNVKLVVAEKKEEIAKAEQSLEKSDKKIVAAAAASGQDVMKAVAAATVAAKLEASRKEYYSRCYSNYLYPPPSFREENPNDCSIM